MPFTLIDAQFIPFLVAITLLSISPGVDTLLVIRNTARGGLRDGIATSRQLGRRRSPPAG